MINRTFTLKSLVLASCLVSASALAGHIGGGEGHGGGGGGDGGGDDSADFVDLKTCKLTDMELTYLRALEPAGQPQQPIPPELAPVYANACYGFVVGNNSDMSLPTDNLGLDNDGWFNKPTGLWADGAFDPELLDLDEDGQIDDPGWVYMGKDEGDGFKGATIPNDDPDMVYQFVDDLFSCSSTVDGTYGTCVNFISGFWKFTPPSTQPELLIDLLGGSFFDQVAVVFKGGNGFAIYNFTLSQLGLDPILAGDIKYEFGGKFDLSQTLVNTGGSSAGLSNISLWARDPFLPTQVAEPGYLALLGMTLLVLYRRRQLRR